MWRDDSDVIWLGDDPFDPTVEKPLGLSVTWPVTGQRVPIAVSAFHPRHGWQLRY